MGADDGGAVPLEEVHRNRRLQPAAHADDVGIDAHRRASRRCEPRALERERRRARAVLAHARHHRSVPARGETSKRHGLSRTALAPRKPAPRDALPSGYKTGQGAYSGWSTDGGRSASSAGSIEATALGAV